MSRRFRCLVVAAIGFAGSVAPLAAQDSLASRARQLGALVDALEAAGDWRNAIAPLDRLLELGVSDPARLRQRGLFAVWSGDTKRGIELLRRAVAENPEDKVSLTALAQVLSWSPATRDRARVLYRRILSRWPGELDARVGLANVVAWDGKPAEALRSYDSVLATVPSHSGALLGRGGALNQLGRHSEAAGALRHALELSPNDATATGELARAELGSGHFRSARNHLKGRIDPMLRGVADSALRATASAAEISGLVRRRKDQLDLSRVTARATGSVGSFKLYGEYDRSELRDGGTGFRSEGYGGGARIDHRGLALLAGGRMQTVRGLASNQWDGFVNLGWRLAEGVWVGAGAARSPVEESRRSVQGELDGGELRGAVHANLGHLTLALTDLPGPFDIEATVLAGRYTGMGLESNRRASLDSRAGLVLNGSQPWVRIGYGFAAARFDYNADPGMTQVPTRRGGYFSPAEYWRHQGIVQIAQRFGSRVNWELDARLGREWVRQLEGAPVSSRNTAAAYSSLTVRLGSGLDLSTRFLYVNAFDAFEMKELSTVLKVYFP